MSELIKCGLEAVKRGAMVRENEIWSVKSRGISFQTKSGHLKNVFFIFYA